MYKATPFDQFWQQCGDERIHPADCQFLEDMERVRGQGRHLPSFIFRFPPCPFDGPLDKAHVVVCLANPNYAGLAGDIRTLVMQQRTGTAPLPPEWDQWYGQKFAEPLECTMDEIRGKLAILNICPYESKSMGGPEIRLAAGLPSVWAAQKYLREILIPRALTKKLHLLILRKHSLWGITEGWKTQHLHVVRGSELSGRIPANIGKTLGKWIKTVADI